MKCKEWLLLKSGMCSYLAIIAGFTGIGPCILSELSIKPGLKTSLYNRTRRYLKYLPTLRIYSLWKSRICISLRYRYPFWPGSWYHYGAIFHLPLQGWIALYNLFMCSLHLCSPHSGPPKEQNSLTVCCAGYFLWKS